MKLMIVAKRSLLAILIVMGATYAQAATYYVNPTGTCTAGCTDWNNAYAALPASLERGSTYYIAGGTYPALSINAPAGTAFVTIKKATAANHGTENGWSSSYASQANFPSISFASSTASYIDIDGQEPSGIKITYVTKAGGAIGINVSQALSNLKLAYIEIAGSGTASGYAALGDDTAVQLSASGAISYVTLNNIIAHGMVNAFKFTNVNNTMIDSSKVYDIVASSTASFTPVLHLIRAVTTNNIVVKNSEFYNWNTHGIRLESGTNTNWYVYNNIWRDQNAATARIIEAQTSAQGPVYFNHNTIVGISGLITTANSGTYTASLAQNNLFYNTSGTIAAGVTATSNVTTLVDQFTSTALKDYRLKSSVIAQNAGTALTNPAIDTVNTNNPINTVNYLQDKNSVTRPQEGGWDAGAYEYVKTPSVPTGLTAVPSMDTQIDLTWNPSTGINPINGYFIFRCQGAGCALPASPTFTSSTADFGDGSVTPGQTYRYAVASQDTFGWFSVASTPITVVASDTIVPVVNITAPANSATISGNVTLTAFAADNFYFDALSVQFKVDGVNVGSLDTSYPFSTSLNTTTLSNGVHVITALATDSVGNTTLSAAVKVTVNNVTLNNGDVNADGAVNITDVLLAANAAVGNITLTATQKAAADMQLDNVINISDVLLIARKAVGL